MNSKTLGIDNRAILGQLFKAAFGTSPVYITVPLGSPEPAKIKGFNPSLKEEIDFNADADLESVYRTPVIFPVQFVGGEYPVFGWDGKPTKRQYSDLYLPATTMVDFNRAKNVIKTNVLGINGTVKEYYGFDDWQIRIRTLCLADKNYTAVQYADMLQDWFEITGGIKVYGSIFSKKEIYNIVIEDFSVKTLAGSPGVIPVEMSAVSNEPVEIITRQ